MRRVLGLIGLAVCLVGCGPKQDLFPLEMGNTWTYTVSSDLSKSIAKLKVARRVPVGDLDGYELQSELGIFHLAWDGGTLVASSLAGTRYNPPLPLVVAGSAKDTSDWSGKMSFMGKQIPASAKLVQEPGSVTIGAKKVDCTKVVTNLTVEGKLIILESFFAPGMGLVEQTQRTSDLLTIAIKYQEGPKS